MGNEEKRKETYERIKKHLGDYRYRSSFFSLGTMVFALLLILSIFPLVPVIIADVLGLAYSIWSVPLWFLCIGVFGALFWVFQRFAKRIEEKRGITLEERMYVRAYESLCFLTEYLDPDHPISGSRSKAARRLQDIDYLLGSTGFPYVSIIRDAASQLWQFRRNLETRLIPLIRRPLDRTDTKSAEDVCSILTALVDYLSKPQLVGLVALNGRMSSLPQVTEKNIFEDFKDILFKRSNLRHTVVFSFFAIFASLVYYVDINYFGATMNTAFELGLMFFVGIVAIYVTYLGLTVRRESRT